MQIILISFPNGQQIIGEVVEENERELCIDNPIQIVFNNPLSMNTTVYSAKYLPFAKDSKIVVNKFSIVSYAQVNEEITGFYHNTVKEYKNRKMNYVQGDDESSDEEDGEETVSASDIVEALIDKKHKTLH